MAPVLLCSDLPEASLSGLLRRFGLRLEPVPEGASIPGSFWGDPEAGIAGDVVYVRGDTPVHSALHEACHLICAATEGRLGLHTDAGGDYAEEDAVCYLQILLAGDLPEVGQERLMADMDAWGYSFRLGSTRAWFEGDAAEARAWLEARGLVDRAGTTAAPGNLPLPLR
jgi:hypothetical protein